MLAENGDVRRAAARLGYSIRGLRTRLLSSPELEALIVNRSAGRPRGQGRVVTDEQIVAALELRGSPAGAAKELGVNRGTITGMRYPVVEEALAKAPGGHRLKARELREKRAAAIGARLAHYQALRAKFEEFRDRFNRERDAFVIDAMVAGLTGAQVGDICGVTRQRIQQIEAELGASRRKAAE